MRRIKCTPSRFNPTWQSSAVFAQSLVADLKRHVDNPKVCLSNIYSEAQHVWSVVYTREQRLKDAAYEESNLWG